ncbi:ATP-grasp domain-containing protein [Spirosoma pollinicola]|uniref:Lipocalin-like domain-containing protein n=1 Tax=Spirosoma pollinicola TaxID=2057025 RepID=A0A2K8Z2R4_9BACT|nr:hypothetical protein [Spirosoma pollinicola]AUD04157.1 hypothetical protein CWM47_21355 [Spirosoma pollinicola]
MKKKIIGLVVLLIIGKSTGSWAQSERPTQSDVWHLCPPPTYSPFSDTLARRATLDSMTIRMAGRWKLIEIGDGWTSPKQPAKLVEVLFDRQGKGIIFEENKRVSHCQLTLHRSYNQIFFKIDQLGQSIFHFPTLSNQGGRIHACEQNLVIGDGKMDGTAFAFRRVR